MLRRFPAVRPSVWFVALPCAILVMVWSVPMVAQVPPQSANQQRAARAAYGSRIGLREVDPNNAGLSGDRRTSRRVNTRIETRLRTRIDRFSGSQTEYRSSYEPEVGKEN